MEKVCFVTVQYGTGPPVCYVGGIYRCEGEVRRLKTPGINTIEVNEIPNVHKCGEGVPLSTIRAYQKFINSLFSY